MKKANLTIEYVSIEQLTKYENNAKLHPDFQVEQIEKSIGEFGMNDPIAVWGKKNTVVEGHGRLMALEKMGVKEVPIIRLDHLTDKQRKQYALVHNKLTMNSDFDFDILNFELESIGIEEMTDFGFEMSESIIDSDDSIKRKEASFNETISVVVSVNNDVEAETLFQRLTGEGYECRISTL